MSIAQSFPLADRNPTRNTVLRGRGNDRPSDFTGTVQNLNNALFALRMHEVGGHEPGAGHEASIGLSTYCVPQAEVEAVRARWQEVLDRLFAS